MGKRKSSHRRTSRKSHVAPIITTSTLRKQLWFTNPYRASFDRLTPNKLRNMGEGPVPYTGGAWRVSNSWW